MTMERSRTCRVILTSRVISTTRRSRECKDGVEYILGNAHDNEFLKDTLEVVRPDAVIDFMSYGTEQFRVRRNLLLSRTGQYVFLSSCRVFAGEEVHTERSPRLLDVCQDAEYLKTDEYGLAKGREENLLRGSGKSSWPIVRPRITYSFPRLQFGCLEFNTFAERIRQGLPVPMPAEMMTKRTTMLHGDDVAEMIARLVFNDRALGEDFNTVTAENHTWAEVGEIYAKSLGMRIVECSLADYKTFCNPYQVQYGRMVHHCFDNTKVLEATGLRQADLSVLASGLSAELRHFAERKAEVGVDIVRNALIDRVLGVRMRFDGWRNRVGYARTRYPLVGRALKLASIVKRRI